jgi:hypothetical protein
MEDEERGRGHRVRDEGREKRGLEDGIEGKD